MFFKRRKKKHAEEAVEQEETVIFKDEPKETPAEIQEAIDAAEASEAADSDEATGSDEAVEAEEEVLEIEFDEDDIQCYLVDEGDNEIGFVLLDEDGNEVEYYYAEDDADVGETEEDEPAESASSKVAAKKKSGSLAYKAGAAAAGAAATGKAAAKTGVAKAKQGVEKARGWADKFQPNDDGEYDLGITREGVKEATADMNSIYHEGVETIAELKEAFDDINESLHLDSFLGKKRRR